MPNLEILVLIFVWAIAEMALIPAPVELAIIPIAATSHLHPMTIAIVGTIGSVLGGMIDYYLGREAFSFLESRFHVTQRVRSLEKRFTRVAKYGFPSLIVLGRVFPIGSLKPLMILAGATRYDMRKYLLLIAFSSLVRYVVAATVGSTLGFLFLH